MASSQTYIQVHWLADVFAGSLLGIGAGGFDEAAPWVASQHARCLLENGAAECF